MPAAVGLAHQAFAIVERPVLGSIATVTEEGRAGFGEGQPEKSLLMWTLRSREEHPATACIWVPETGNQELG